MNEHTPEPWKLEGKDIVAGSYIPSWRLAFGLSEANARRIVACVNACKGIPTDILEGMIKEDFTFIYFEEPDGTQGLESDNGKNT